MKTVTLSKVETPIAEAAAEIFDAVQHVTPIKNEEKQAIVVLHITDTAESLRVRAFTHGSLALVLQGMDSHRDELMHQAIMLKLESLCGQ